MERLSDYDYVLPEDRIAQRPLADRSASRLLHLDRATGKIRHRSFTEVPEILQAGDLLVLNDTRVSALRMLGRKPTGAAVEALILQEASAGIYYALLKPGRRLGVGARIIFGDLVAEVVEDAGLGRKTVRFEAVPDLRRRMFDQALAPLPPYIHEPLADKERYQTVYAAHEGSAAAPTAGLHFTPELLISLAERGVETATVTLQVGLDTFRPVQAEDPSRHLIQGEFCSVPTVTAEKIAGAKGRIVAVGTTSVRTLETFATGRRRVEPGTELSRLFIRPGFEFQVVDGMFTNFHMPKTTMMMMISAFAGRDHVMNAYAEAIQENYRFLSFGDSMFIV